MHHISARVGRGAAALLTALSLLQVGCGTDAADGTTCGAGTELKDGACVPTDTTECGDGTVAKDGKCVPSDSTECGDGTELKDGKCVPKATTECGPDTKLVDGKCEVDTKALRPEVTEVSLTALSIDLPSDGKVMVLHPVNVRAAFDVKGEAFETEVAVGLTDGTKWCPIGVFDVSHAPGDETSSALQTSLSGERLVQPSCADLAGGDKVTVFVSFDPFLKLAIQGRSEPTDVKKVDDLIKASMLGFDKCTNTTKDDTPLPKGAEEGAAASAHCADKLTLVKSPGRDAAMHGAPIYSNGDQGGGAVVELETFPEAAIRAETKKPSPLPTNVTETDISGWNGTPAEFGDLQGSGATTPALTAAVTYVVYGLGEKEEVEEGAISVRYEIRPRNVGASGDAGEWESLVTKLEVEAKAGEDPTVELLKEQFLDSLMGPERKSTQDPLFFPPDLRKKLNVGAWKKLSFFDLRACLEADFDEKGGDAVDTNNCHTQTLIVVRREVEPSQGALRTPPTSEFQESAGGSLWPSKFQAELPELMSILNKTSQSFGKSDVLRLHLMFGGHSFINLQNRWQNYFSIYQHNFEPAAGFVAGFALQAGTTLGNAISHTKTEGADGTPELGLFLTFYRPWNQPFAGDTFGTADKFVLGIGMRILGNHQLSFSFPIFIPNIGTPFEIPIFEKTYGAFSLGLATLGENKNGLKFALTLGFDALDKLNKGLKNKTKQWMRKGEKVSGVQVECNVNVTAEASFSMQKKLAEGKLPPPEHLPQACKDNNGACWQNADGTRAFFTLGATKADYWAAWSSQCIGAGGRLYYPAKLGWSDVPTSTNIPLAKYLGPTLGKKGGPWDGVYGGQKNEEEAMASLEAAAWQTPDPLAFIMNLPGALALDVSHKYNNHKPLLHKNLANCPSYCQSKLKAGNEYNQGYNSCYWNPWCTAAANLHPIAVKLADKIAEKIRGSHKYGRYWVDYRAQSYPYGWNMANLWNIAGTSRKTWWPLLRPIWMAWGSHHSTNAALELDHYPAYFWDQTCYQYWEGSHVGGQGWAQDLHKYQASQAKDVRRRFPAPPYCPIGINEPLLQSKHRFFQARLVPAYTYEKLGVICEFKGAKLGDKKAESFSYIMTPGASAKAEMTFSLGFFGLGFGLALEAALFELEAPFEWRAMRAEDNSAAQLAVFMKATLQLIKIKFDVFVQLWGAVYKKDIYNNGNGVKDWSWDLFGPYTSDYGCSGSSCNLK